MLRTFVLTSILACGPAAAFAVEPGAVAPPGVCAGEERDLGVRAEGARRRPRDEELPAVPAQLLLSPTQVAAAPASGALPFPSPPSFAGPGACDTPGSGCAGGKRIDDPNPGTGCGFPGSPCP